MDRFEQAARATRHAPSAADIDEAIKAKLDDQIGANPANTATEDRKNALDGCTDYTNIGIDSGYASHSSSLSTEQTSAENTENEVMRGTWPFQRKRKVIDKPIPQIAMERLANLRILLSKPLKEYISRPNVHKFMILWKLKYLGVANSDASLYLIVSCDKRIASKVKDFFAQSHIREQIGSHFRVYIQPLPPILLNSSHGISVYTNDDASPSQTLCGTPIAINWNGQIRTATLGGILMIHNMDSPQGKIFGITAGHIAPACSTQNENLDHTRMDNIEEDMFVDDAFEEDFELDIEFEDTEVQEPQNLDPVLKADDIQHLYIDAIGTLVADSSTDNDWALIKLHPSRCLPNYLPLLNATKEQLELFCTAEPPLGAEMAAGAICAPRRDMMANGLVHGTISRCESGIMMSSGSQFVEVYDFVPKQSSRFAKGDSGSWVVNEETGRVYGQVVAVDAFGEAVVMPMLSILKEIESRPAVTRARLPYSQDVGEAAEFQEVADLIGSRAVLGPLFEPTFPLSTSTDSGYGSTSNDASIDANRRELPMQKSKSTPLYPQSQGFEIPNTWPGVPWDPWDGLDSDS